MSVIDHFAPSPRESQGVNAAPRINPLPFLPLPTAALTDPRLAAIDRDLLIALLKVAMNDVSCYPSIKTLAGLIRRSERCVQYHLQHLVRTGWARLEPADNGTGRIIVLCWRESSDGIFGATPPQAGAPPVQPLAAPPPQPDAPVVHGVAPPPVQPGAPDVRINVTPENRNVDVAQFSNTTPENPTQFQAATSAPMRPIPEAIKALPGASQAAINAVAWQIAHRLGDQHSVYYIMKLCGLVAGGLEPVARLLTAYEVAARAIGKARKPGALMVTTWAAWQPAPLPSAIRYYQAPSAPQTSIKPPDPAELQSLRGMLAGQGKFTAAAMQRVHELKLLGVDLTAD